MPRYRVTRVARIDVGGGLWRPDPDATAEPFEIEAPSAEAAVILANITHAVEAADYQVAAIEE